MPCFLNSSTYRAENGCILLIGILDTLIRNVLSHGESGEVLINFNKDSLGYYIEIKNNINNGEVKSERGGLTKQFWGKINSLKAEGTERFRVLMHPDITDAGKFVSELFVRKGGFV